MKSRLVILPFYCIAAAAQAATPADLLADYEIEAARKMPAFKADARRGAEFYARRFGVSEKMPACSACHREKPTLEGRHAVTNKPIKPLAPAANAERLTDPAKVEKWFGRNCREVVGRACTSAEKADLVAFLLGVR